METSKAGLDLIKSFEGLRLEAYTCPVGVLTIGYGHTGNVSPGQIITESEANKLLKKDLTKFERAVKEYIKVELNQYQFDALVSFAFNIGTAALKNSTLVKRLNIGDDPNTVAEEELPRWDKGRNGVLEGLKRRRSAEVELFCKTPPTIKTGLVDITSTHHTWLKKRIAPSYELKNNEKASIYMGRTIKNCTVLDKKDQHTLLEMGFGLGKWWIYDQHWRGLVTETKINPYATDNDLRYLRNFPYFYQTDNGPEGWRQCQTSSIAMCLKYFDVPGINDDRDYLKIVNKYGDTTKRQPHFDALAELGVFAKFTTHADAQDVKDEIDKGRPVAAGILHHGAVSAPHGGGHFIVITGYSQNYWLVQDPYGELDLVNGGWEKTGPTAGRNVRYSFKNMNPRFFYGGGSTGWCWLNFKRNS